MTTEEDEMKLKMKEYLRTAAYNLTYGGEGLAGFILSPDSYSEVLASKSFFAETTTCKSGILLRFMGVECVVDERKKGSYILPFYNEEEFNAHVLELERAFPGKLIRLVPDATNPS